jgi:hypothetical protein
LEGESFAGLAGEVLFVSYVDSLSIQYARVSIVRCPSNEDDGRRGPHPRHSGGHPNNVAPVQSGVGDSNRHRPISGQFEPRPIAEPRSQKIGLNEGNWCRELREAIQHDREFFWACIQFDAAGNPCESSVLEVLPKDSVELHLSPPLASKLIEGPTR